MRQVVLICCWLLVLRATAQSDFSLINEQQCGCTHIAVDGLGNLYYQGPRFIERRNALGGGKFRNSELQWGSYESIDLTDPLRPFIYFASSGKLVFWDNTLSVQGSPIDVFEKGFDQIELICGSRGDALWMWDSRLSELIRVDRTFSRLTSTGNLSVLLGFPLIPVQLMERGSSLYVRTADHRLLMFDIYGTYKRQLQFTEITDMQIEHDRIFVFAANRVEVLEATTLNSVSYALPLPGVRYFASGNRLYGVLDGTLRVYQFPETTRN